MNEQNKQPIWKTGFIVLTSILIGGVIGIVGWSLLRPPAESNVKEVVVVVTATPSIITETDGSNEAVPTDASSSTEADVTVTPLPTPSVMDLVLADTRHFQGDASAPITMIEFSDFK